MHNPKTRLLVIIFLQLILAGEVFSQKTYYGDEPLSWADTKPITLPSSIGKYQSADLVILNDQVEFYFYGSNNEKVFRSITFKINTETGLQILSTYRLPESFDRGFDLHMNKQGRAARIKVPLTNEYTVKKLGARKFAHNRWSDVPFKLKYERTRWVRSGGDFAGEFADEDYPLFQFENLAIGDVVQLYYEATFNSNYGNNLFYFNSVYPKLECEYTFNYRVRRGFEGTAFILPVNIHDTLRSRNILPGPDYSILTDKIRFMDLKGINYVSNSFAGKKIALCVCRFSFLQNTDRLFSH